MVNVGVSKVYLIGDTRNNGTNGTDGSTANRMGRVGFSTFTRGSCHYSRPQFPSLTLVSDFMVVEELTKCGGRVPLGRMDKELRLTLSVPQPFRFPHTVPTRDCSTVLPSISLCPVGDETQRESNRSSLYGELKDW